MFINEVENIVGLSKKSIRFYEEEGLINPSRENNGYRVYNEKDIRILRTIKFLRELNVSIKEIKDLKNGELSLEECMIDRINKIESEEENYNKIKSMCKDIIISKDTYDSIDITKYFQEIRILNKRGFTMRDLKINKKNKIFGAVLSSIIFIMLFVFIIGIIVYFQFSEDESIPWILYYFIIFILALPIFAIFYNLVMRIKEINGGEEDEASKY